MKSSEYKKTKEYAEYTAQFENYLNKKNNTMNKEQLQEKITEFKSQVSKLRESLKETGEQFLKENLKDMFEKFPQLEVISWTQYTPYFNDGEECTFSSNHDWPEIEGEGLKYGEPAYEEIRNHLKNFMAHLDDDLMYDLFGDHVQIVVTKDGISVEEYDHE